MMQSNDDLVGNGFDVYANALIGAPVVGVLHDVAGRLVHRQLQLSHAVFVER